MRRAAYAAPLLRKVPGLDRGASRHYLGYATWPPSSLHRRGNRPGGLRERATSPQTPPPSEGQVCVPGLRGEAAGPSRASGTSSPHSGIFSSSISGEGCFSSSWFPLLRNRAPPRSHRLLRAGRAAVRAWAFGGEAVFSKASDYY